MSACVKKLYTIKDANELFNLLKSCNSDVNVGYVNPKYIIIPLLGNYKVEDYLVSFQMLNILNEKIWPKIVKCVLNSFEKKTHTFRIKMPLEKINIEDTFKKSTIFTEDTRKWLAFHLLGEINEMRIEKDAIILEINLAL